jgi:hypothetical protein
MKSFHHGKIVPGNRLWRVLRWLREAGQRGATTIELNRFCRTTRASSDISELRRNAIDIVTQYVGKNRNGNKVYRYRLS